MAFDKIQAIGEKKYSFEGIFDIKNTYNYLKEFLEESRHYDVSEKDYEEKNVNGNKKIVSKSVAEAEYNDYFKIIIKYELAMEGKDIEIKINEKKKQILTKGKAKITINTYIEPNFNNKRPQSILAEFLNKIVEKFYGESELEKCIDAAASDVGLLLSKFKHQMNSVLK